MKFALISDIHANYEALTNVLADIDTQKVDKIFCLGDVIGYGTDPIACLDAVTKYCDIKLMGNHEYAALGLISTEHYNAAAKESSEWTKTQLSDNELSLISDFEMSHTFGDFYLVHASPFEPDKWRYIIAPNAAIEGFMHFTQKICFNGHSHLPQIFTEQEDALPRCQAGHDFLPDQDSRYIINVGSVGQPRDNDNRACYLIFDTVEYEAEYRRVEYDIAAVQTKMTELKMPEMLINRLSIGR